MVSLAKNAGFGLDKIESNWLQYNPTQALFSIDFDSTILRLTLKSTDKDSDKGEDTLVEWGEKWEEISDWWRMETSINLSVSEIKILDMIAVMPVVSIGEVGSWKLLAQASSSPGHRRPSSLR